MDRCGNLGTGWAAGSSHFGIRPSPSKSFTYHAFALEWITAAWMAVEVVIAITASVKARSISLLAFDGEDRPAIPGVRRRLNYPEGVRLPSSKMLR
jgi:hypothetical protein